MADIENPKLSISKSQLARRGIQLTHRSTKIISELATHPSFYT